MAWQRARQYPHNDQMSVETPYEPDSMSSGDIHSGVPITVERLVWLELQETEGGSAGGQRKGVDQLIDPMCMCMSMCVRARVRVCMRMCMCMCMCM